MTEKLLLTVAEAAAMASVGRSTGYALVASGEWPSISIGRARRVPVEALRTWVKRKASSGLARSKPRTPGHATAL